MTPAGRALGRAPGHGFRGHEALQRHLVVPRVLANRTFEPRQLEGDGAGPSLISPGASLVAQTVKTSPCDAGDLRSTSGSGSSPGKGGGNPLQYSCPWTVGPGGLQSRN